MALALIDATSSLRIEGICYEGCPMMIRDGHLDFVPSRWIASVWQQQAKDTARAYASHLKKFLTYLESRNIAWWDAQSQDITLLQSRMRLAGGKAAGINPVVGAVAKFYEWCHGSGYIVAKPFISKARLSPSLDGEAALVRPIRASKHLARYVGKEDFDRVCAHIPSSNDEVILRNELMFECGHYMGFRRQEVAGILVQSVVGMAETSVVLIHDVNPDSTKGKRGRSVPMSLSLVQRLKLYITVYRSATVARAQAKCKSYEEPKTVFLTLDGRGVRREYVMQCWANAARAAGLPSRFHMNRHWFGTAAVASAKARGDANPLLLPSQMLGHASTDTTKMYDHTPAFSAEDEDDVALITRMWANDA